MQLPNDDSKWTARFRYLEVAHYVPSRNAVIREKIEDKPLLLERQDVERYREAHRNIGVYSSVFHYDSKDLTKAARLGNLYFDLDSSGGTEALDDTRKLVGYLLEYVSPRALRIYFTGQKGFHVECEAIALGVGPTNDLAGHFRYIATQLAEVLELATLDFAVYDNRRMWRLPNSIHQHTGLYKRELTKADIEQWNIEQIRELAKEPSDFHDRPQEFEPKANEWYREWTYKREAQQTLSVSERIARFQKYGTGLIYKEPDESDLEFTPDRLLTKCPAINKLLLMAEETHDLPHEARLFLCSLLTYNQDAEEFLHYILSQCDDYSLERSMAHINDWKRRRELGIGGRPYTCDRARAAGVGCESCDLEPREKLERIGNSLVKTGEEARPSPYRFAYERKQS